MRHWFLLFIASICSAYNGCLHQRSICLRTPECNKYLDNFEETCGYSLSTCTVKSPSDCVHSLWRIRDFFPYDMCVCYEALGFPEECNEFRELIWNHPCERRMRDTGEQRKALEQPIYSEKSPYKNISIKRTTRTPLSDQIRQLKSELSFELGTREVLRTATCDSALNDVCLRHVSCRQLWKLFRSSCGVDQENRCTMTDRDTCWQSFEGLSWTGLGNCHCDTDNSDCHWIRLHTNYNKCIHDIIASGQLPPSTRIGATTHHHHHNRRPQVKYVEPQKVDRVESTVAPVPLRRPSIHVTTSTTTSSTSTTSTSTTTTTTSTTTTSTTTTTKPPRARVNSHKSLDVHRSQVTTPIPPSVRSMARHQHQGDARATPAPTWWQTTAPASVYHSNQQRHIQQTQTNLHYRPLIEPQVKTTPSYYYHYTTAAPRWEQSSRAVNATMARQNANGAQTGVNRQAATDLRKPTNGRWNVRETQPQLLRIKAKLDSIQQVNQAQTPAPTQASLGAFTQKEHSVIQLGTYQCSNLEKSPSTKNSFVKVARTD